MADRTTSRWPTVTGLWLGLATWAYAALASVELLTVEYDPTAPPEGGYDSVSGWALPVTYVSTAVLGAGLLLALLSVATGRARRSTDLLLALGLGLGAGVLWIDGSSRPVASVVAAAVGLVLVVAALLPARPAEGRLASFLARLVLATVALLLGWVCAHELAEGHWQISLSSTSGTYLIGLGVAAVMLLAALLGPLLAHPVARWVFGLPTVLVGLFVLVVGGLLMDEGRLLIGYTEVESGWRLGGPPVVLGAGLTTAGLALLRRRPTLAVGTVAAAVLMTLAVLFGIPEIRNNF